MREKVVLFGQTRSLVGVITAPESMIHTDSRPGVILLNAGVVHRIGPNRLHVKIARRLSCAGFAVLRFDLSGIGDSKAQTIALSLEERVVSETQRAMDLLSASHGLHRFVLIGICTGAQDALRVARSDQRVIGAVLIESYPFSSLRYIFYLYSRHVLYLRSWQRFISGKSQLWSMIKCILKRIVMPKKAGQTSPVIEDPRPSKEKIVAELRTLVAHGVNLLFIYSRNGLSYYNYRSKLKAV